MVWGSGAGWCALLRQILFFNPAFSPFQWTDLQHVSFLFSLFVFSLMSLFALLRPQVTKHRCLLLCTEREMVKDIANWTLFNGAQVETLETQLPTINEKVCNRPFKRVFKTVCWCRLSWCGFLDRYISNTI